MLIDDNDINRQSRMVDDAEQVSSYFLKLIQGMRNVGKRNID